MRVLVGGKNVAQVQARQASIGQDGVDDVPLDLEALVSGRDLAQVTGQQVRQRNAAPLGVVHEEPVKTF